MLCVSRNRFSRLCFCRIYYVKMLQVSKFVHYCVHFIQFFCYSISNLDIFKWAVISRDQLIYFSWKKNSGRPVCSNRDNLRSLSCVGNDFRSVLCTATSSQFTSRIAFRNANHEHCTQVHVWNVMERRPRPTGSGRTLPAGRVWRNRTPYAEATTRGSPWVGGWVNVTGTEPVNHLKVMSRIISHIMLSFKHLSCWAQGRYSIPTISIFGNIFRHKSLIFKY